MRRVPSPPPGNLDALLNTVTNALGILLILLAVTQLGVDDAVDHIEQRSEDRGNTQVEKMVKDIADSRAALMKQREQVQAADATLPNNRKTLEANRREISSINAALFEGNETAKVADAQRQFDELSKTVNDLEAKIAQANKETAELTARLENAPPPAKAPEALVVSLPNPRPAAPTMRAVELVCHRGRVTPYNEAALRKIAQEHVKRALSELQKPDGIDCKRLKELFENEEIGNAFFRIEVVHDGKLPELVATDRGNVGESADTIEHTTSLFQEMLRSVDRRNEWIRFRVFPDSFETYFAAREIAARKGFSVGWQPCESDSQQHISLGLPAGVYCSGYKVPSAAPPKADVPKIDTQDPAKVVPKSVRIRLPNQRMDSESPDALPNPAIDATSTKKGPLTPEERAIRREQRKAQKAAREKAKEKSKPPDPGAQSSPKGPPMTTPPPATEPAKPAAQPTKPATEPAKPATTSVPNDDID